MNFQHALLRQMNAVDWEADTVWGKNQKNALLTYSVTPDRGREFRRHGKVTTALGVEFYAGASALATRHQ